MFDLARFRLNSYWKEWLQTSSPCFWKNIFIFLNLFFLVLFSAQFIFKIILDRNARKTKYNEEEQKCSVEKAIPGNIRVGNSYQVCKWSCSAILLCQILELLLFPSNKYDGQCELSVKFFSEIMKALSCIIMLVGIFTFRRKATIIIPWTIRLLCLSIFLEFATSLFFKLQFILSHKLKMGARELLNMIALFSCMCLTAMSVRGQTGISVTSSSVNEPLLNGSVEKQTETKRECPYGRASLSELVTFSWLNPLFSIGIKKPLEQHEVPDIDVKDSAEFLSQSFDECLERDSG
ncbi:ABC transporter C family member 9-like [Phalaenopsis equestris]|uniref:ABC transporter C family member 9-like n=1 Tax=Phalaenopsis equestris TaxID=78828 RepID=UPI0009E3A795|nr:ABC transporter C family member 9-like [Phalaenopsis equestris]